MRSGLKRFSIAWNAMEASPRTLSAKRFRCFLGLRPNPESAPADSLARFSVRGRSID
jgi:hypothetical protein